MIFAQSTPTDPGGVVGWAEALERGGVIFLLVVFILLIVRRYFAPWYVIEMKDVQIAKLEVEKAELKAELRAVLDLADRSSRTARDVVTTRHQQLG